MKYREGILLGSACEAGELYRTLLRGSTQEEVARIVQFYDYLEIQPLGNNAFMLRSDKEPIESEEDLKDINRQIVELGEQFNNLICIFNDYFFRFFTAQIFKFFQHFLCCAKKKRKK